MSEFYRKITSDKEHFILNNLNLEIESALNSLECSEKSNVLDVGCGKQPLKEYFENKNLVYKGLDYKQNDLNNIDYISKIDAKDLNIKEKFEVILCTEVLEHVLDWKQAFINLSELSPKNGVLFITCPFFYPLHEIPYDYWRPTNFAIIEFAKKNGYEVILEKKVGDAKDLAGIFLNYSYITSQDKSIITKIKLKIINYFKNYILRKLKEEDSNIEIQSPFYVSNLFILRKK